MIPTYIPCSTSNYFQFRRHNLETSTEVTCYLCPGCTRVVGAPLLTMVVGAPLPTMVVGAPLLTILCQLRVTVLGCNLTAVEVEPVHSLMLSSHRLCCLYLFLFHGTVPCMIFLQRQLGVTKCPNHRNFLCFTVVNMS